MMHRILIVLFALASLGLSACGDFGKVEQGRCVAYNKDTKMVTFIKDTGKGNDSADFMLPAVTYAMPVDPAETGAEPKPGLRMKLDTVKKIITMYNPAKAAFEDVPFELVDEHKDVDVRKNHVLVYDVDARKPRVFPQVNAAERKVTIYSSRQKMLSTIRLSEADFARYKEADWDAGHQVRIYYKEEGKSLRFMNVTRTDIYKR